MSAKRLLLCTAIGMALLAGGLTAFSYGLAQVIEIGNCGTDEYGRSVGPPCPSGTGWLAVALVGGVLAWLAGTFVFAAGGGAVRFSLLAIGSLCVAGAAAVLGAVDLHASDTRPGREVLWIAGGFAVLVALAGTRRSAADSRATVVGARPAAARFMDLAAGLRRVAAQREGADAAAGSGRAEDIAARRGSADDAARTAGAEDIAARLRQLDQLRQSGLLPDDDYAERRRQILAEL